VLEPRGFTLWLFNIAVENGPFIEDFPIKTSIYKGFSMAMLNNQRVDVNFYSKLDIEPTSGDVMKMMWTCMDM